MPSSEALGVCSVVAAGFESLEDSDFASWATVGSIAALRLRDRGVTFVKEVDDVVAVKCSPDSSIRLVDR